MGYIMTQLNMHDTQIPILKSYAVMRQEYFGGILFNCFLPPELKLDHIRFKIALMCNGEFSIRDIKNYLWHELNHSQEYVDYLVKSTLSQFDAQLLLYWRNTKINEPRDFSDLSKPAMGSQYRLSAPLTAIWEITRKCNLKCKHCFSNSGQPEFDELSLDEIKKAIDQLVNKKILYINFTGGEPLLRPDLFDILSYASSKRISINLSTNGFLINEEFLELLLKTNIFSVQISIDGLSELHDSFRGARGAFQRCLDAVHLLREADIIVEISTAVNKTNIVQISEIIDQVANAGASVFKTTLFIPVGRGKSHQKDLALTSDDVYKLAIIINKKEEEMKGRLFVENRSCYPWLLDGTDLTDNIWIRSKNVGCSAGNTNIFIKSNGDVAPCPFLRDLTLGNLRKNTLDEIWESKVLDIFRNIHPGDLQGKCQNCEHLGIRCYGGCRAAALAYSGDLYGEDPFCWK